MGSIGASDKKILRKNENHVVPGVHAFNSKNKCNDFGSCKTACLVADRCLCFAISQEVVVITIAR